MFTHRSHVNSTVLASCCPGSCIRCPCSCQWLSVASFVLLFMQAQGHHNIAAGLVSLLTNALPAKKPPHGCQPITAFLKSKTNDPGRWAAVVAGAAGFVPHLEDVWAISTYFPCWVWLVTTICNCTGLIYFCTMHHSLLNIKNKFHQSFCQSFFLQLRPQI